jgi:hypothetical protein
MKLQILRDELLVFCFEQQRGLPNRFEIFLHVEPHT